MHKPFQGFPWSVKRSIQSTGYTEICLRSGWQLTWLYLIWIPISFNRGIFGSCRFFFIVKRGCHSLYELSECITPFYPDLSANVYISLSKTKVLQLVWVIPWYNYIWITFFKEIGTYIPYISKKTITVIFDYRITYKTISSFTNTYCFIWFDSQFSWNPLIFMFPICHSLERLYLITTRLLACYVNVCLRSRNLNYVLCFTIHYCFYQIKLCFVYWLTELFLICVFYFSDWLRFIANQSLKYFQNVRFIANRSLK